MFAGRTLNISGRRLVASLVGVATAALLAATATPAQASHALGSGSRATYFPARITDGKPGHSPVYVVLIPVGSDIPMNALVAAKARASLDQCNTKTFVDPSVVCSDGANVSTVRHVQIDRLELDYVGSGRHHIYTSTGPINTKQASADATTPGQGTLPCSNLLAIRLYISVRYADGSLSHYGVSGPTFTRC